MRSAAQKQVQRVAYSLAHHVVANSNAVREKLKAIVEDEALRKYIL